MLSKEKNNSNEVAVVVLHNVAVQLFKECSELLGKDAVAIEMYLASLSFLAKCSEAGLYYR